MVQIQFLGTDVVRALVPVFSLKPGKALFFYDGRDIPARWSSNVEKAIRHRLPDTDLTFTKVDCRDFDAVRMALYRSFASFDDPDIVFVTSGGTEVAAAAGQMVARQVGGRVVFADLKEGRIRDVRTGDTVVPAENASIDDYLTTIGAKRIRDSHSLPSKEDEARIFAAAEWTFSNLDAWHALQQYLASSCSAEGRMTFTLPERIRYNGTGYDSASAIRVFREQRFVVREGEEFRFPDSACREYMTTFGIWLELYVYFKAQYWFDEVYLGFVIDWDSSDLVDTVDNEIDVLAVRDSVPCFISCKMRKPVPKDLYEVAYLANRFGGESARALVATTYPVSSEKDLKSGLYNRFRKMGIGALEVREFSEKKAASVFRRALK